jgi:hypothetical protein
MEDIKILIKENNQNFENESNLFLDYLKKNKVEEEEIVFRINNVKNVFTMLYDLIFMTKTNLNDQLFIDSITLSLSQLNKLSVKVLPINNTQFHNVISGNIDKYLEIKKKCMEYTEENTILITNNI